MHILNLFKTFFCLFLSLFVLVGCGNGDDDLLGGGDGGGDLSVVSLLVTPSEQTIPLGFTGGVTATATFDDGSEQDVTNSVAWSIADDNVIEIGADGVVNTLTANQSTTVTATYEGVQSSNSARVTVTNATVESLLITPVEQTFALGRVGRLTATATFSDGSFGDVTRAVSWNVDSPDVIGVIDGRVFTQILGSSTVSASLGALSSSNSARITVTDAEAVGLVVAPKSQTLALGDTFDVTATVSYSDGSSGEVTDEVTWKVSNDAVVEVNNGVVISKAVGQVSVSASLDGLDSANQVQVVVNNAKVERLVLSTETPVLPLGVEGRITATAVYSDDTTGDVTELVDWSVSETSIIKVVKGVVTTLNTGTTAVSASLGEVESAAPVDITVNNAEVDGLLITPSSKTLPLGEVGGLAVKATFSDGNTVDVTRAVSWEITNSDIISITDGIIKTKQLGETTVTASFRSRKSDNVVPVTVIEATIQDITLSEDLILPLGERGQLKVMATYSDGSSGVDVTDLATWTVGSPNVALVTSDGTVLAESQGTTTVMATVGEKVSNSVDVTVTNASVTSLTLSPAEQTFALGESRTVTATATFSDGTTGDVTRAVSWDIANGDIIGVVDGIVFGQDIGTTTLTASFGDNTSNSVTMTVEPAKVTALTISEGSTLPLGGASRIQATATFSDGSTTDVSELLTLSWTSGDKSVVDVILGRSPFLEAKKVGKATLQASLDGVDSNIVTWEVTDAALQSLRITKDTTKQEIALGLQGEIRVEGRYSDSADFVDVTGNTALEWKITQPDTPVISIASGGEVNTLVEGEATVTAILDGQTTTNTATVTVTAPIVTSLEVTTPIELDVRGTKSIQAFATYSNNKVVDVSGQVVWDVANTRIAAITAKDNTATVSGFNVGDTQAEAMFENVSSNDAAITVNPTVPFVFLLTDVEASSEAFKSFVLTWEDSANADNYTLCLLDENAESQLDAGDKCYVLLEGVTGQVSGSGDAMTRSETVTVNHRILAKDFTFFVIANNDQGTTTSNETTPEVAKINAAIGYLKASNAEAYDATEMHLDITSDGTVFVVSAAGEDSCFRNDQSNNNCTTEGETRSGFGAGAAYVFEKNDDGVWAQKAYLKPDVVDIDDYWEEVAISDDGLTIVMGSIYEDSCSTKINQGSGNNDCTMAGAAVVFEKLASGEWVQTHYLKASNAESEDRFGFAVDINSDGTVIAVGATGEDSNSADNPNNNEMEDSGAVYIFDKVDGQWTQTNYIKSPNPSVYARFGEVKATFLSKDGLKLVAGSHREDSGSSIDPSDTKLEDSGAVFVYERPKLGEAFELKHYLKANNLGKEDFFGIRLDVSDGFETIVVSASGEDGDSMGITNGLAPIEETKPVEDSGAYYIFEYEDSQYRQTAYIKAAIPKSSEGNFTFAVNSLNSIGNKLALGFRDYSDRTGVGLGDMVDDGNDFDQNGIALLEKSDSEWKIIDFVKAPNSEDGDGVDWGKLSGNFDTLIFASGGESSSSIGSPENNSASRSGAIYIY